MAKEKFNGAGAPAGTGTKSEKPRQNGKGKRAAATLHIPPAGALWSVEQFNNPEAIPDILAKAGRSGDAAKEKPVVIAVRLQGGVIAYIVANKDVPGYSELSLAIPTRMQKSRLAGEKATIDDLNKTDALRQNTLTRLVTQGSDKPSESSPHVEPVIGPKTGPFALPGETGPVFHVARPSWVADNIPDLKFITPAGGLLDPEIEPDKPEPGPEKTEQAASIAAVILPEGFGKPITPDAIPFRNLAYALTFYQNGKPLENIAPQNARDLMQRIEEQLESGPYGELTGLEFRNESISQQQLRKFFDQDRICLLTRRNGPQGYLMPLRIIQLYLPLELTGRTGSFTDFKTLPVYSAAAKNLTIYRFKLDKDDKEGVLVAALPFEWLARLNATAPGYNHGIDTRNDSTVSGGP